MPYVADGPLCKPVFCLFPVTLYFISLGKAVAGMSPPSFRGSLHQPGQYRNCLFRFSIFIHLNSRPSNSFKRVFHAVGNIPASGFIPLADTVLPYFPGQGLVNSLRRVEEKNGFKVAAYFNLVQSCGINLLQKRADSGIISSGNVDRGFLHPAQKALVRVVS